MSKPAWFTVEQAIWSERDQQYGFRVHAHLDDEREARKLARKIGGRLVRCELIGEYMPVPKLKTP